MTNKPWKQGDRYDDTPPPVPVVASAYTLDDPNDIQTQVANSYSNLVANMDRVLEDITSTIYTGDGAYGKVYHKRIVTGGNSQTKALFYRYDGGTVTLLDLGRKTGKANAYKGEFTTGSWQ